MADDSIQRDIGILIGKVDAQATRFDNIESGLREATSGRSRLHERVEIVGRDVSEMKNKVNTIETDVEALKPEVELVKGLRMKAMGAIIVLGALGALIFWGVQIVWGWVTSGSSPPSLG